jgi:menaquinone-dependent protoporphyrinogen oxidase
MSRVLVAYATKNGATREIAEAIAEQLRQADHDVDCERAEDADTAGEYDAFVIGSAMYMKRWRRPARRLLSSLDHDLGERPIWLFSSGPCGADPDPSWSEPSKLAEHARRLGAADHVVFGGRLPVEPGNFVERAMVEKASPEERDLRDWDQIRSWAAGIGSSLPARRETIAASR